jgi:KDO2-lipid IV(A) lauroyltransferase
MSRIGIGLLWLLWRLFPNRVLAWLGAALGEALHHLTPSRRHIARTNLRLCFPEMDEARLRRIIRGQFRALGRVTLLEAVSWWGSRSEVEALTRFEGLEHMTPHAGKPVIWLAPHFLGLNIGGVRVTAEFAPIVSLYSRIKNPHLDRLMLHARTRFEHGGRHSEMFSRQDGIKPVVRAIRRGLPFYYLPDMDYGARDALFIPFFGVPAATITALPRLVRATGAAVIPAITREEGGHFITRFYPAWEHYPTDDLEADVRRMNAFIEDRIREMPEQYFWLHKRFKTRPPGTPALYT